MERVILIKYGELTTKKGNRSFFVKTLVRNIEQKLKDYDVEIEQDLQGKDRYIFIKYLG